MGLTRTADPAVEPVSLDELKAHLRISGTDEDDILEIYLAAARGQAETRTGRALVSQTWRQTLDFFPTEGGGEIRLLVPYVRSISSVQYVDTAGDTQTLSASDYSLDAATPSGWLLPADGSEWPSTDDVINAVTITYVAGYGDAGTSVPAEIRAWILMTAGALYAQREAIDSSGRLGELPARLWDSLLDKHVVYGV